MAVDSRCWTHSVDHRIALAEMEMEMLIVDRLASQIANRIWVEWFVWAPPANGTHTCNTIDCWRQCETSGRQLTSKIWIFHRSQLDSDGRPLFRRDFPRVPLAAIPRDAMYCERCNCHGNAPTHSKWHRLRHFCPLANSNQVCVGAKTENKDRQLPMRESDTISKVTITLMLHRSFCQRQQWFGQPPHSRCCQCIQWAWFALAQQLQLCYTILPWISAVARTEFRLWLCECQRCACGCADMQAHDVCQLFIKKLHAKL